MTMIPRANLLGGGMLGLCAALGVVVTSSSALAQGAFRDAVVARRATIIDDALESRKVDVISLDVESLVYLTRYGREREMPRSQLLAIVPEHTIRLRPARSGDDEGEGLVMLTDGRRLSGRLSTEAEDLGVDESLSWSHPVFGALTYGLTDVSWLVQPGSFVTTPWNRAAPPSVDEVLLFNGDRLTGFLAQLGETVVIEDSGSAIRVERHRVSAARLANPAVDPDGARLWLHDGSVVRLESFMIDEAGSVLYTLDDGQSHTGDWAEVSGVLFDAARLTPLSSLTPIREAPAGGRRFAEPSRRVARLQGGAALDPDDLGLHYSPALDVYDILLPGPLLLEYELPESTRRFGCTARLDIGTSPWGDCRLSISVDGIEMFSRRLATSDPEAEIVIDTPGRQLAIEIDPGNFGPINDRVILERAVLLLGEEPSFIPGRPGR